MRAGFAEWTRAEGSGLRAGDCRSLRVGGRLSKIVCYHGIESG